MDNMKLMFQSSADAEPTFHSDRGFTYCTIPVFRSDDPDLVQDPLSTNRRLPETADLEMFGTMVVAVPTPDQIYALIPDSKCGRGVASRFTTRRWTQPGLNRKSELHVTSGGASPRPL